MNFKPGDKVWVKFPHGEYPDEIIPWKRVPSDFVSWCEDHPGHYFVALKENVGACTTMLRPRYDGDEKTDWSKCVWRPTNANLPTLSLNIRKCEMS